MDNKHTADEMRHRIRDGAKSKQDLLDVSPSFTADIILPFSPKPPASSLDRLIVVGASTGGTEALKTFLMPMPSITPPILIAQHMPEMFTRSFAARLDSVCRVQVKEAEDGEQVKPGVAYIAPGHSHLMLALEAGKYICSLSSGQPVNRHRPSVDVLFRSAANCAGKLATGVLLTGMGKDGAQGMLEMHQAGAYNFAQDEASCVVFGMPREAIALGAVDEIVNLGEMAHRVLAYSVSGRKAI